MDIVAILRAAGGVLLLAYLPGRAWVGVLLPRAASRLERLVASVGLSVAMMVLAIYLGNVLLGIRVAAATAVWHAVALSLAGLAFPLARRLDEAVSERLA